MEKRKMSYNESLRMRLVVDDLTKVNHLNISMMI